MSGIPVDFALHSLSPLWMQGWGNTTFSLTPPCTNQSSSDPALPAPKEHTHVCRVCETESQSTHTGSVVRVSLSDPITTNSLKAKTAEKVREREMAFNVG